MKQRFLFWNEILNYVIIVSRDLGIPNVQEVQMFIQTYLKFYQEYF